MSRSVMRIVGYCPIPNNKDVRPVWAGVFAMYDTHGLPFNILFDGILSRDTGDLISWEHFRDEALAAGWKSRKIQVSIDHGLRDAGYHEMADAVTQRLKFDT